MNKTNNNITFDGLKITLVGAPIQEGQTLPDFVITGQDFLDINCKSLVGAPLIVLSVPSLDTAVCAAEIKRFNSAALDMSEEVRILVVSMDLPFAQKRWCGAEGVTRITTGSDYKYRNFGSAFGVYIQELGLLSRAVFVADREGFIVHVEYVQEIVEEPDYAAVLAKVDLIV